MKKIAFALALATISCASPIEPSAQEPIRKMVFPAEWHHNIPFTRANGSIGYLCATQPREYLRCVDNNAPSSCSRTQERDHYDQDSSCPAVPIQ